MLAALDTTKTRLPLPFNASTRSRAPGIAVVPMFRTPVSVQKEHVVVPGNVSQRFYVPDMPVAAAWCREPVPSRLVGFECLVCRNRNQMIAPRTFAETHSLIITAARMTRRIRLTCGQASTLSDADS